MPHEQHEWVILGLTDSGEVFDAPDWPARLCDMLADQPQDNRPSFSGYLHAAHIGGLPAVVILSRMEQESPAAFAIVKQFVGDNRLKTRAGRRGSTTGKYPAMTQERRQYLKG